MTVTEFSDQFDVLYNNITSNQAPGLNEYEKSVFLTKAQNEIIKNYFTKESKGNSLQQGFDDSSKRQIDFSTLIDTITILPVTTALGLSQDSIKYFLPNNIFIPLNEELYGKTHSYNIIPISYIEYGRLMSKPYKFPPKNQAWRLITGGNFAFNNSIGHLVEIIGKFDTTTPTYMMRYIKYPDAIILTDLSGIQNGLTIQGSCDTQACTLPDEIHEDILQRAVELAKIAWGGDNQNITNVVQAGLRSE